MTAVAFFAGALLAASVAGSDRAFVGSQVCRGCHAATHSSWSNGRHSRMIQEARPSAVIPPFDRSVNLHGKDYGLEREGDSFFIVESYLQPGPVRRRVDYTLGSRRVQHYLTRLEDGRIVVLPPSFDVEKKEWFHNLDIVDLEETGAVKVQVWNSNCYGCHVSGEQKNFDPAKRTYATTWTDFGTTCERCHGPGGAHAAKYSSLKRGESSNRDTLIVHPRRVDAATSTTLCAQCHSLRDVTSTGFAGGDNYFDFFTPLLEFAQKRNHDPSYWPNGRPRRFSNEAIAFWLSQCSFKGGAVCISCHSDVHEPDIDRNPALAAKQDDLCAGCHREIASAGSKHSRHAVVAGKSSASVSCVDCHMPRTSISLRHRMPDHSLSVPAPENTRRFGIPNACNECHKDKTADWAEGKLQEWFPNGRRERAVLDAVAFTMGANRDPKGVGPLAQIAGDPSRPPLFRANALGYLRAYNDRVATSALVAAASDPQPAVRLGAFLSLTDLGRDPEVRAVLARGLGDARRTVRMASALGLLNANPEGPITAELWPALEAAMSDHANRAAFLVEDSVTQLDLGKMYFLAGNWKSAEASVRDALRLDPNIAGGQYFLGLATIGQGRVAEGTALLRKVDRSDPHRKDAEAVLSKLPAS